MRRIVTSNGLRIVAERMPHLRGISLGVFIGSGTTGEAPHQAGLAHLLEHMIFKGTQRRTAEQIARQVDRMGACLDGATFREFTAYYARVGLKQFPEILDILSDMVINSQIAPEELERERNVIFEEVAMYEDAPEDLIHDLWAQALWGTHPFGWPILGTRNTLASLSRQDILDFYRAHYHPSNIVVSFVGDMNLDEVKDHLEGAFSGFKSRNHKVRPLPVPRPRYENVHHVRDLEQVHFSLGGQGLSYKDERRFDLLALNTILGGTASSRLFQEVREKRGLAYSIYSSFACYKETGVFVVSGGTLPENAEEVYSLAHKEMDKILGEGVSKNDLEQVRDQLKGSFVLDCDHAEHRMMRLAKMELYGQPLLTVEETLKKFDAITVEGVNELAREILDPSRRLLVSLGPDADLDARTPSEDAQPPLLAF